MIMTFTMRRESREDKGHRAWLDTGEGGSLLACTLVDISASGAKLSLDAGDEIPDTFSLRLTRYGQPRFACRTVWRNANTIGVTFARE
jgi:PilZ domain-containing protein